MATKEENLNHTKKEYQHYAIILVETLKHSAFGKENFVVEKLDSAWKDYKTAYNCYFQALFQEHDVKDRDHYTLLELVVDARRYLTEYTTAKVNLEHRGCVSKGLLKEMLENPMYESASLEPAMKSDPVDGIRVALEITSRKLRETSSFQPHEERQDLVNLVCMLQLAEDELDNLSQIEPEQLGIELHHHISRIKAKCSKLVDEKWNVCSDLLPKHLSSKTFYQLFKDAVNDAKMPPTKEFKTEPERNLARLKRLIPKPEVEMVRSHKEFWNVLDFIYGDQDFNVQCTSMKRVCLRRSNEGSTVMVSFLRPTIKPPISTSAVDLFRLKSFREQRSSIPCLRSCGAAECDHNVLVFDGMIVEEDATPMGLGMEDHDVIGIIPRYDIRNVDETDEIVESFGGLGLLQTIIYRTKRYSTQVSVGLNVVVGEKEGGLPLLKNQDLKHREELANLKTALLPALEMTMEGWRAVEGKDDIGIAKCVDSHPDFSSVRERLEAGVYTRASQGLKEVESILERYGRLAKMASKTSGLAKEGKARLQLHKSLVQTMNEFHWAINGEIVTYIDAKQEAASALASPEPDSGGPLVYLGPVRNATPNNFLASLPIVQFQGVSKENSIEQLIDAWCHYTKEKSRDLERPEYVMYNNKRCDTSVFIKDLGMVLEGLYFSLPLGYDALVEDDRDIEQLLEFIEGDDGNEKKKKKKRKKKTGVEQSPSGEKSKVSKASEKVIYDLVIRNVPYSGTFGTIQQEIVDLYSAHGTIEDIRAMDPTGHCWCFIATVTFKNKAALLRSAEAMKSTRAHLAPHHRLVVREALKPFLDAWKEREGKIPQFWSEVHTQDYLTKEEQEQLIWLLNGWGKATCELLVRNIPPNCTNQDLVDIFSVFGRVVSYQIIRHRGWPKVATVTFTSSDAIMGAVKAGRSRPFMLEGHELVVEDGCRTDIAYANYMADCQLVVEKKRVLDERKRSTEAAKKITEVAKKSSATAKRGPEVAEGSLEGEKKSAEADINQSREEENVENTEMLAASSINCSGSQGDLIAQPADEEDKEGPNCENIPSPSRASHFQKISTEERKRGAKLSSQAVESNEKLARKRQEEEHNKKERELIEKKELEDRKLAEKERRTKREEERLMQRQNMLREEKKKLDAEKRAIIDSRERRSREKLAEENEPTKRNPSGSGESSGSSSGHETMESCCSKAVVKDDQKTQIEEKEARLQETRDYLEYVKEIKGKKMADLINTIEDIEDLKNKKLKEISVVEMKISDLQADLEKLVREVKESDDQMISVAKEKRYLETDIENNIRVAEKEIALLEADIESLKIGVPPDSSKEDESEPSFTKRKTKPNMQLLEYIDNKIAAKEKELECPVCLEVASAPIFMCSDLHLICSDCRPKVSICPECREPYPDKAKRHRYAEKAAEELAGFMEERAQVLDT